MKKLLGIKLMLAGALFSWGAFAGSTQEVFECSSASGRTEVYAEVPGDHAEHSLSFAIDDAKITYFDGYGIDGRSTDSSVEVLGSLDQVKTNFHFMIRNLKGNTMFTFLAIPGTVKIRKTRHGQRGVLDAYVVGFDPREVGTSPTIRVSCSYVYEI